MAQASAYRGSAVPRPRSSSRRSGQGRGSGRLSVEKTILGVPERFMKPRLVLIAVVVILTCFGFLMVYSASSITSLTSDALGNDPAYYLKRQLAFAAAGTGFAVFIATRDYHLWGKTLVRIIWILTIGLLLLIFLPIAGSDAYGATRWIAIGPFTLQPSEFAKITIILVAADLAERYYDEQAMDFQEFVKSLASRPVVAQVVRVGPVRHPGKTELCGPPGQGGKQGVLAQVAAQGGILRNLRKNGKDQFFLPDAQAAAQGGAVPEFLPHDVGCFRRQGQTAVCAQNIGCGDQQHAAVQSSGQGDGDALHGEQDGAQPFKGNLGGTRHGRRGGKAPSSGILPAAARSLPPGPCNPRTPPSGGGAVRS